MDISSFICKRCGAEIEIGAKGKIATCKYCGGKYNITFSDGSFSAQPVGKNIDYRVKELINEKTELEECLKNIEEGKKKWKLFLSSVFAGKGKKTPEMQRLYEEAKSKFIMGYGIENKEVVSNYCNIDCLYASEYPVPALSCYLILIGTIVSLFIIGAIFIKNNDTKPGIILISSGLVLLVFMLFAMLGVRGEKKDEEDKKEAKKRLSEIEREMKKRLDSF